MNINRHNYEVFFLLYVDNELSNDEKAAVELFVQQNPDLQAEFEAIREVVLPAADISFDNKEHLLKKEEGTTNVQHQLLLLLDNELAGEEEKNTQRLIQKDKDVALEWEILQETKLQPDTSIILKNKKALYRKEAARVINFDWRKMAAAAVLIGFGLWIGINYFTKSNQLEEAPLGQNERPKPVNSMPNNANVVANVNVASSTQKNIQENNVVSPKNNTQSAVIIAVNNSLNQKRIFKKLNLENFNKQGSNETIIENVLPTTTAEATLLANAAPSTDNVNPRVLAVSNVEENSNLYVANAVYEEEPNDNKILYIEEETIKRTKIGGLFRKVKRVFERTASIKTGDGIKLAGFEIALK